MRNPPTAAMLLALTLRAFAADNPAQFEIATLKAVDAPGESYPITLGVIEGNKLHLTNTTLSDCIKFAYGLVSDDQLSGPDWIRDKTILFDIVAEVPPNTSRETVRAMTQALLADRLKLVVRREEKELRYLALSVGKGGPKMARAKDDSPQYSNNSGGRGHVDGNQVSMALLASFLSRFERELILDRTALPGYFEVKLRWEPETGSEDCKGPSLYTALQEQLGLQLKSGRGPVEVLVVESAARIPAEN